MMSLIFEIPLPGNILLQLFSASAVHLMVSLPTDIFSTDLSIQNPVSASSFSPSVADAFILSWVLQLSAYGRSLFLYWRFLEDGELCLICFSAMPELGMDIWEALGSYLSVPQTRKSITLSLLRNYITYQLTYFPFL